MHHFIVLPVVPRLICGVGLVFLGMGCLNPSAFGIVSVGTSSVASQSCLLAGCLLLSVPANGWNWMSGTVGFGCAPLFLSIILARHSVQDMHRRYSVPAAMNPQC